MRSHGGAKPLTLEQRLFVNETRPARDAHLDLGDPVRCETCAGRECTRVCPAGTYEWAESGGRIVVSYENCLECGACRLVCPHANITWRYPMGGMGICYRYG